jgi:hypothetical protein
MFWGFCSGSFITWIRFCVMVSHRSRPYCRRFGYRYCLYLQDEITAQWLLQLILIIQVHASIVTTTFNNINFRSPCKWINHWNNVGFGVLTAMVKKGAIFWDIMPCSPLSQLTFRRNISPPSSGSENKLSEKPAWKQVASKASPCC